LLSPAILPCFCHARRAHFAWYAYYLRFCADAACRHFHFRLFRRCHCHFIISDIYIIDSYSY
jgi:hypothetical protein